MKRHIPPAPGPALPGGVPRTIRSSQQHLLGPHAVTGQQTLSHRVVAAGGRDRPRRRRPAPLPRAAGGAGPRPVTGGSRRRPRQPGVEQDRPRGWWLGPGQPATGPGHTSGDPEPAPCIPAGSDCGMSASGEWAPGKVCAGRRSVGTAAHQQLRRLTTNTLMPLGIIKLHT